MKINFDSVAKKSVTVPIPEIQLTPASQLAVLIITMPGLPLSASLQINKAILVKMRSAIVFPNFQERDRVSIPDREGIG